MDKSQEKTIRECISATRMHLHVIERLLRWEQNMGGWEAPVWDDVVDAKDGLQITLSKLEHLLGE